MTAMNRPIDLSPEHAIGRKTAAEWAAIARAHVAGLDHGAFTAAQDLALCEGLWAGYKVEAVAAKLVIPPMDAVRRFRAIIAPLQLRYSWRDVFPIDAQTALLAALREVA